MALSEASDAMELFLRRKSSEGSLSLVSTADSFGEVVVVSLAGFNPFSVFLIVLTVVTVHRKGSVYYKHYPYDGL